MSRWVFIDVDGTLIDQWDNPRPYVRELFEKLRRLDCKIIVWSAGGHEYARSKIGMISRKINFTLHGYVTAYWWKAWYDQIVIPHERFFIDDVKEMLEAKKRDGHAVFKVPFYDASLDTNKEDEWLLKAADAVEEWSNEVLLSNSSDS